MDKFWSICLYYLIFFIAFCFFLAADNARDNSRSKLYTLLGVLVLCLFAGARDLTVGYDTERTVFARFIQVENAYGIEDISEIKEPIYRYVSFILHKITHKPWIFLFLMQLLTAGPVAVSLYKFRKKMSISIGMLFYMFLIFQHSLNIMRQSVAAGFLLLAFAEYANKSYIISLILVVLCTAFHSSGIIGIFMFSYLLLLAKIKSTSIRKILVFANILLGVLAIFVWKPIFSVLISSGFLINHYYNYVAIFSGELGSGARYIHSSGGFYLLLEMVRGVGVMLSIVFLDIQIKKYDTEMLMMKYASVLSFALYSVTYFMFNTSQGIRLVWYLDFLQILLFARLFTVLSQGTTLFSKGIIRIMNANSLVCILYPFAYNFILIMLGYNAGTLPYVFS